MKLVAKEDSPPRRDYFVTTDGLVKPIANESSPASSPPTPKKNEAQLDTTGSEKAPGESSLRPLWTRARRYVLFFLWLSMVGNTLAFVMIAIDGSPLPKDFSLGLASTSAILGAMHATKHRGWGAVLGVAFAIFVFGAIRAIIRRAIE